MRRVTAFVFLLVTLLLAAEARAQTLHAILIGDTSDGTIGPGITANLQKINSFLNVVETIAEIPVARYEIKDAAFNCKAIVDQLRSIDVSSNDVVLFYYSGHGFRRDTSQTIFPEFDCRRSADETRAALADIATYLRSEKKPGLVLLLADTCNVVIEAEVPVAAAAAPPQDVRKAALRRLLLGYSGGITASGSTPGNPSWYMNSGGLIGGFFTNQFLRVLDRRIASQGANVRWQDIMTDAAQPITIPTNPPTTQIPQFEFQSLVEVVAVPAAVQEASEDEINPALLRRLWDPDAGPQPAAPYVLTAQERARYGGTFGIDLSHYSFDVANGDASCRTQQGYSAAACSCAANWQSIAGAGVKYVYTKASDGRGIDLSFKAVWLQLEPMHKSGALFRGAYHFFRPDIDPDTQADAFLRQIGAVDGQKPAQLPPALDIEWSNKRVSPGDPDFEPCGQAGRRTMDNEKYYCDMWYKRKPAEIAEMARKWIDHVEAATGRRVIVYTNPTAWWNAVMTPQEDGLLSTRSIWTSRYTAAGPAYDARWTTLSGSARWKMAPLPRGVSYPQATYNVPHHWQFTEGGKLPGSVFTCGGQPTGRSMDMNWVPVGANDFPRLFGITQN
jgi:GH25 family lysozyme M1 (1,4-beta-N-acetylmuramidase)